MKVLFLSISTAISNLNNRGIYPDLLRKFAQEGHDIFIVAPAERRQKIKTNLSKRENVTTLLVQTFNITKANLIEKGISTLLIEVLFSRAIRKYFKNIQFDLILYATPPISFNGLIRKLKNKHKASTYLLLKDIFPQNAVDLGMLSRQNPLYHYFKKKETALYKVSDFIGCMSPANVKCLLTNNAEIAPDKIEVCPNSILPLNPDPSINKDTIRKKYGLPDDKVILIYGGNLGRPQGIDFLLEVLLSNKNRADIYFIIAGSGTEKHKIDKFIASERPSNILLLSHLPRKEFDLLVNVCDIGMIFLDKRYTIPNYPSRLLNYLVFKKPVLMGIDRNTDVGTIAEENNYGIWVESGDLVQFNKKLNDLASNPTLLKWMGENGYRYLMENYTVDKQYEIIMSHFM
ncbi:MAG: glycosyltransferase family 4 protein [Bacteroidales bacterium]|nr:glycosyltransferase family 4 protein [Bacteroidales bacterium]